ncbi:MAG: ferric reductase-like transmembrane domain-containing protein [Planctomycetaceae bacterium]|jgi:predicted ferric reductase|nr:ferric reductase-like transmembrane domain-containing protein [Planctomycetaceae bacterium]
MRGPLVAKGVLWVCVYLALALAPLAIITLAPGANPPGRGFWTEFSVALGFVGLSMMGLQFALTARFSWLKAPYGSDIIYAYHKWISIASLVLILAHPAILFASRWQAMLQRPFTHPWPFWLGTASVLCLLWLVIVSVYRRRLRLEYDAWRRAHAILGISAAALGIIHALLVGHYLDTPAQRALWLTYALLWVGLIVYVRIAKPILELRRPWQVAEVRAEGAGRGAGGGGDGGGDVFTLALKPVGHPGIRFAPGQFAWITLRASPFSDREHPFSISSSPGLAERTGIVEFTIKQLGDFSSTIKDLRPGEPAYLDGPFGALSADRHPDAPAFLLLAGGIGITPMISHLRTFVERRDTRPVVLVYAANTVDQLPLRAEIDRLVATQGLNLKVVYVLARPPEGWTGERGFITADLLRRHWPTLPANAATPATTPRLRAECFICGPEPMMAAVEDALLELRVSVGDIHAERFNLV